MITPTEIITEGYRSLASRTLRIFDEIYTRKAVHNADYIEKSRDMLARLSETGRPLKDDYDNSYMLMMGYIERTTPRRFDDKSRCATHAFEAVLRYYGITFETYKEISGLDGIELGTKEGRFTVVHLKDESVLKMLYLPFDAKMPIRSLVADTHEIIHPLQREFDQIRSIFRQFNEMDGVEGILGMIAMDDDLLHQFECEYHLEFFQTKTGRRLIKESKIDRRRFDSFLDENLPLMNYLRCKIEGEAYVYAAEILSDYLPDQKQYELYALLLALSQQFVVRPTEQKTFIPFFRSERLANTPLSKINVAGIGLAEYTRLHPKENGEFNGLFYARFRETCFE
jgi:hypothetical protein